MGAFYCNSAFPNCYFFSNHFADVRKMVIFVQLKRSEALATKT